MGVSLRCILSQLVRLPQWAHCLALFLSKQNAEPEPRSLSLGGHVGFDSLPDQLVSKSVTQGFSFNILCVGKYVMAWPGAPQTEDGRGPSGRRALLPWPPVELRRDLPGRGTLWGFTMRLVPLPESRTELEPRPDSELP